MTLKFQLALILTATLGPPVRYVFYHAKLLPDDQVYQGGSATNLERTGPLCAQAITRRRGLPFVPIGYGVYWLVRRRRGANRSDTVRLFRFWH